MNGRQLSRAAQIAGAAGAKLVPRVIRAPRPARTLTARPT